jgi:hypothetical protein
VSCSQCCLCIWSVRHRMDTPDTQATLRT